MTDYKKLCEDLREYTYWCGSTEKYAHDVRPPICDQAANAIEELQAERDKWFDRHKEAALNWQESARCVAQLEAENERLKKQAEELFHLGKQKISVPTAEQRWTVIDYAKD